MRGGRSIDDDDSEADLMWVGWLVGRMAPRARDERRGAVIQYGISVGKSLQLHERAKEKELVKEWTSERGAKKRMIILRLGESPLFVPRHNGRANESVHDAALGPTLSALASEGTITISHPSRNSSLYFGADPIRPRWTNERSSGDNVTREGETRGESGFRGE